MVVEVEGEPDERGMVIDFQELKKVLKPLVDAWDHAVLVADQDTELRQAIDLLGTKHYILPFDSTSENLCLFVIDYLCREGYTTLVAHNVVKVRVRVQETETCYAELERPVAAYAQEETIMRETHATR